MKRKLVFLLSMLIFSIVLLPTQTQSATQEINVIINGEKQEYDQPPVLQNGRTLVPLRGIFETLGAKVNWNQVEKKVTATKDNQMIVLTIGSYQAEINDKLHKLDVEAKTINYRTMVPLRFIGEALGEDVHWEQSTKTVFIGGKIEIKPNQSSSVLAKVKSIYENTGAKFEGDINGYFAGGNGINQSYVNNILVIFNTGSFNNFTVAAQVANKLGGSGDVSQIAAAIDTAFKGESGGPVKVGNVSISPSGRTVTLKW
ncbi:copper amine oxidase N-terminal domain-containing protein [Ammoniphilus resinae]|uniref:Copper amine oxidase-like N-terminal domain-containing protein n=1 Tax=Ammoniphilus resinae TaxID=861532 RepID=A0ABS4GX45_9BACL|nr:copper amine oxidase N-terminal domain-containing protein [Ammoniphilus resinae]MBP1934839.1 hypothetical protein [Ammoniphilus resinae]